MCAIMLCHQTHFCRNIDNFWRRKTFLWMNLVRYHYTRKQHNTHSIRKSFVIFAGTPGDLELEQVDWWTSLARPKDPRYFCCRPSKLASHFLTMSFLIFMESIMDFVNNRCFPVRRRRSSSNNSRKHWREWRTMICHMLWYDPSLGLWISENSSILKNCSAWYGVTSHQLGLSENSFPNDSQNTMLFGDSKASQLRTYILRFWGRTLKWSEKGLTEKRTVLSVQKLPCNICSKSLSNVSIKEN